MTELAIDTGEYRNLTGLWISDTIGGVVNDGVLMVGRGDTTVKNRGEVEMREPG